MDLDTQDHIQISCTKRDHERKNFKSFVLEKCRDQDIFVLATYLPLYDLVLLFKVHSFTALRGQSFLSL